VGGQESFGKTSDWRVEKRLSSRIDRSCEVGGDPFDVVKTATGEEFCRALGEQILHGRAFTGTQSRNAFLQFVRFINAPNTSSHLCGVFHHLQNIIKLKG